MSEFHSTVIALYAHVEIPGSVISSIHTCHKNIPAGPKLPPNGLYPCTWRGVEETSGPGYHVSSESNSECCVADV